jgi:rsbT co-antagonist protein RsbR
MSVETQDKRLVDGVAQALSVLSKVKEGEFETRIAATLPSDHPLYPLISGINEMIDAFQEERQRKLEIFDELQEEQQRSFAYQAQLEEKLATIEQQREAIRELSSPIMEIWHDVVCLPIVGVMDTARSAETTSALLEAVAKRGTKCAIIDITGIEVMDTRTADHFIKMAQAVRLLGAECLLTGVNPTIADTVVQMGLDLKGIETHRSLREALQSYVSRRRA